MPALRLGVVAIDHHTTLKPYESTAVTRDNLEMLVLQVRGGWLETRGLVGRNRGVNFLAIRHVRSRAQVADGARAEAQKLDGRGHCVCWVTWVGRVAPLAGTGRVFYFRRYVLTLPL
jgi:hypothetical protein